MLQEFQLERDLVWFQAEVFGLDFEDRSAADVGAEQFVVGGDVFACDWVARHVEIIRAGREILSLRGANFSHLEGFFP